MISPVRGNRAGFKASEITVAGPAVELDIAVEDLPPIPPPRNPDPVVLSWDRREVADHQKQVVSIFPFLRKLMMLSSSRESQPTQTLPGRNPAPTTLAPLCNNDSDLATTSGSLMRGILKRIPFKALLVDHSLH